MGLVIDTLNGIRGEIAADKKILTEARARRDVVADAAMETDGSLRSFRSGSLAHGTVNGPVTDADGGIVLDRRAYTTLGPDGDNEGPEEIVDELRDLIGEKVRKAYPKSKVVRSRRGLLVEFNDPVSDEQDPTVDLIVTLTRKDADGLWIPDLDADDWSASHPEKHTELFTGGTKDLRVLRARVTRLAKAHNKQWEEGGRALSSFNVEALVWEYIDDESIPVDQALAGWFAYARDEIEAGETLDPAGVSEPIRLMNDKATVLKRITSAAERLAHALKNEDDEEAVKDDLATVFFKYVKPPAASKAAMAGALRGGNAGVRATSKGLAIGAGAQMKTTRSYGKGDRDG
jgi:hypothetical protein